MQLRNWVRAAPRQGSGIGLTEVDQQRFAAVYRDTHADVLRFVARRLNANDGDPMIRAEDVTHEAYLVAWKKLAELPLDNAEARAWLFTIARNCLLNDNRSHARSQQMQVRIAEGAEVTVPGPHSGVELRVDLSTAWATLNAESQEVLALSAWEGLNSTQAAQVLGISSTAYRMRLSRARTALRSALTGGFATATATATAAATTIATVAATTADSTITEPVTNASKKSQRRNDNWQVSIIDAQHAY